MDRRGKSRLASGSSMHGHLSCPIQRSKSWYKKIEKRGGVFFFLFFLSWWVQELEMQQGFQVCSKELVGKIKKVSRLGRLG